MVDVFISYSSKDKEIADKVCKFLDGKGIQCWIAPRDIPAGKDFPTTIVQAIESAKVFLLIYSKNSSISRHVKNELENADINDVYIIPYKIDDTRLTDAFKYYLTGAHWITADCRKNDFKLEELYKIITGVTGKDVKENYISKTSNTINYLYNNYSRNIDDRSTQSTKVTYPNGNVYEGEFKDGYPNGKGKMICNNGDIYECEWKNGMPNGMGKCTYANGNVYEGEFIDGARSGKGKMTATSGDIYEGEFKDGLPNGKGKKISSNGFVIEGEWKDGKLLG